jgi:hypothetical protein
LSRINSDISIPKNVRYFRYVGIDTIGIECASSTGLSPEYVSTRSILDFLIRGFEIHMCPIEKIYLKNVKNLKFEIFEAAFQFSPRCEISSFKILT